MSKFYVIASSKELKNKFKTFEYTKFDVDFLREFNQGFLDEKFHYFVEFPNMNEVGYNIKNYHNIHTDNNKQFFIKFLSEIEELLNSGYDISLYQFWESSENYENDKNYIYQIKEISTNPEEFMEDYFSFDFNTKYIFVQNLTLNN